ncbi:MAG: VOC family protein [Actinophytocola sp.]|nr:VOC family protein [Actinophytocola sp.]
MQKITPFLWFVDQAEQAAEYYTSIFPDSRIVDISYYNEAGPGTPGKVMTVTLELAGQRFVALNGGPHDEFNDAISLAVDCASQQEVDELWDKLTADGGRPVACGWLKDRYGVSWQIIPSPLLELVNDPDPERAMRVTKAMLGMTKLDIESLREAHAGG